MKFLLSALVFLAMAQISQAEVVVAECQNPKVQLISRVQGSPYHILTLSEDAKRAFKQNRVRYNEEYSDLYNFSTYIPGSHAPQSNCILWTNMMNLRTDYTLDMCGNDWLLKAHIWDRFYIGKRDSQIILRNCVSY